LLILVKPFGRCPFANSDFPSENPRTQTRNVPYTKTLGNIGKMNLKLISSHIIITLISILGFTSIYEFLSRGFFEIAYAIIHLTIILILYLISGYLLTDQTEKFEYINYPIIGLIGLVILTTAIIDSPNDLNWKSGNGGFFWLIYRLYVSGIETPFNFNDNFSFWTKNIKFNIFILGILSIIPSILQALGGFLRIKLSKPELKKTLPNTS